MAEYGCDFCGAVIYNLHTSPRWMYCPYCGTPFHNEEMDKDDEFPEVKEE